MLLSRPRIFPQTALRSRPQPRTLVRPKALSTMDVTNIIVGVIAVSLIVDVGKTFYRQHLRNQEKDDSS